jgi:hypothetical protein
VKTRRRGDKEKGRQGEGETRRRGDKEKGRQGEGETRRSGGGWHPTSFPSSVL